MKRIFLLLSLPLLFTACGDNGGDTPPPTPPGNAPSVLLSRENPIRFSAAATENYTVTVTTTLAWSVSSDKTWCKVAPSGDKFTVSADANTADSEPGRAIVSVKADGKTWATLFVTQEAAVTEYPATIEKFTDAIRRTWSFDGGPYESLTFMPGSYVLVPRAAVRSDAPGNAVAAGPYVVSGDLRTVTLQNREMTPVATLAFVDMGSGSATVDFTPAGGSESRMTLMSSPATDDRAPCRRLKHLRADVPGEGVLEYDFTWSGGRLVAASGSMGSVAKVDYALSYPADNRLVITATGSVEGERIALTATFTLDGQGRAVSMQLKETSGDYLGAVNLAYRGDGRLGFYEATDARGRFSALCQTEWSGGNLIVEHVKSLFPWDEDGDGLPDHDFNGDGVIDKNDRILYYWNTISYAYSQKENIASLMLPFEVYEVYEFDGMGSGFGYVAYLAGVLGPGTKHLLLSSGREFRYEFDAENYPTKVSVVEPEDSSDNFDCTLEFAWPE